MRAVLLLRQIQASLVPIQPFIQWVLVDLSLQMMWLWHQAHHSPVCGSMVFNQAQGQLRLLY